MLQHFKQLLSKGEIYLRDAPNPGNKEAIEKKKCYSSSGSHNVTGCCCLCHAGQCLSKGNRRILNAEKNNKIASVLEIKVNSASIDNERSID